MSKRPPSGRGTLEVHSLVPRARVRRRFLLACAGCGARRIRRVVGHLTFVLIDDRSMARLHRTFLGIRGSTDVLAFDLTERQNGPLEGDVYICLDQARRQARAYRVPLYQEVGRLAAHGVLHLAGYRDRSEKERLQMRRLEDRCLQAAERSL